MSSRLNSDSTITYRCDGCGREKTGAGGTALPYRWCYLQDDGVPQDSHLCPTCVRKGERQFERLLRRATKASA